MKKSTKLLVTLLLIFPAFLTITNIAQAGILDQILGGFSATGQEAGFNPGAEGQPTVQFVPAWIRYINGLLFLMGALFAILVIYGGWLWMTARGNDEQVKKGQNILIQATIGIGIVIGGRIIFEFVINALARTVQ